MAEEIEPITPEVKDPIEPEEEEIEEGSDSSHDQDPEGDEPEDAPEVVPEPKVEVELPIVDGIQRLADENDREFAQRLEINRLRKINNANKGKEIIEPYKPPVAEPKKESEVLKKYKAEDIKVLREVLPELAAEMGYVRKDELAASSYETIAQEQIDSFVQDHPEYSLEKDPSQVLWNQLKTEYQTLYKAPTDPKNYKKVLERIHKDIFGLQPKGPLPKDDAKREKATVASRTGSSAPARYTPPSAKTGLRLDMLKGFSDDDKANIQARGE